MINMQVHWEKVYSTKEPDQVSWCRPHLETSLVLIGRATQGDRSSSIIDVGGGASTLVDDLISSEYRNLTVLDISQTALDFAEKRLGDAGRSVQWVHADVTDINLPDGFYDVWHDRAVFHFLTRPEQRLAYVHQVASAVKHGGHVIVSTFGPEGPTKCSGLDVLRYDAEGLHRRVWCAVPIDRKLQGIACHTVRYDAAVSVLLLQVGTITFLAGGFPVTAMHG